MNERKRLPRCIDDGYDNVGFEADEDKLTTYEKAWALLIWLIAAILLCVEVF